MKEKKSAILFHATHNFVDQVICMQLTSSTNMAYYVGETGFITIIASIIVAIGTVKLFWKKRTLINKEGNGLVNS